MKVITNLDLTQNELQNAAIQRLATAPGSPVKGQVYFNTTSNRLFYFNGTEWIGADAVGATMTGANIVDAINSSSSIIDDDNLSAGVQAAVAKAHDTHTIGMVTGLQASLDGKASTVHTHSIADTTGLQSALDGKSSTSHNHTLNSLSNVTITSNASGEILKWSGTAWINNTLAEAGIAASSHSHAISNVTGLQTALDGKVDDSQVLTDVPANAKFTDTVTTINGKTGTIAKADIVALGIPAENTTYSVFNTTTDGLVPKATTSNTTDYLRRDGTWAKPPNTVYTLPVAGTSLGGVKSGTDITVDASGNVSVNDNSHSHTITNVTGLQTALDAKETPAGASAKATTAETNAKSYADDLITTLLGSAPAALDTLHELAAALGNDPNFATTVTNELTAKTNKFTQSLGDGSATSFVLTHNLNTRDAVVMIRTTGSPYDQVIADVEMTTVNTTTVKFAVAPTANQYTITIVG